MRKAFLFWVHSDHPRALQNSVARRRRRVPSLLECARARSQPSSVRNDLCATRWLWLSSIRHPSRWNAAGKGGEGTLWSFWVREMGNGHGLARLTIQLTLTDGRAKQHSQLGCHVVPRRLAPSFRRRERRPSRRAAGAMIRRRLQLFLETDPRGCFFYSCFFGRDHRVARILLQASKQLLKTDP